MEKILASRYQVVSHLGGGGFGQTFLAKDTHLPSNPLCVVKQLKPKNSTPETLELAKRLFDREAETLYRLGNCDRIPRLLAHFEQEGEFYLVQEYIEGQPLDREFARATPLNESSVIDLLHDILQVLAFVHQQNVIHRDIKPANLIRRRQDGKIVLIDFGAVKEFSAQTVNSDGSTSLTVAIGSPGYMPSEQQAGKPHFSSDIYAVGMVCLEAITGRSPKNIRPDSNTGEICCALFADSISISSALAKIIDKMLKYDYRQRYQTAAEVLQLLQPLIEQKQQEFYQASTIFTPLPSARIPLFEETQLQSESENKNEAVNIIQSPLQKKAISSTPQIDFSDSAAVTTPPIGREEYRDRQILLNKVKNYWIKGVLETSLHGRALIELGLEERLDALDRPWSIVWESDDTSGQTLPPGTRIIDKFDELGAGRTLLILGEPGSGKTTTLLELARDLIDRALRDIIQPMTVVFNLSSWLGEKQKISTWLVEELHVKYQVSKEIGQVWIKSQQLLLLLDGLDEVRSEMREACVKAINQFSQEFGQTELVVCSRIKDYQSLATRLRFQGAIYLQSLTDEQIYQYLVNAGSALTALTTTLQADTTLQELARSPLLLSIMTLAYQGMSITDLPQMNLEERRRHLFNTYIERMFKRRGSEKRYSTAKAKRWLICLAQRLVQQSETVFLIEQMQCSWLRTKPKKWLYALCVGSIGGLSSGLSGALMSYLIGGIWSWPIYGLILGVSGLLITGLIWGLITTQINPVETLKWSWEKAINNLILGVRVGLGFGMILALGTGLISWVVYGQTTWLLDSLIYGLNYGVSVAVIFILLRGLNGPVIEMRTVPNQGIWQSAKHAMIFALIGMLGVGTACAIVGLPIFVGTIMGLLFGLFGAGEACIKHFTLRIILYCSGYIPWNYAKFLDYATEIIFLQKVGGGYIFIHRLLLEHFAAMRSE